MGGAAQTTFLLFFLFSSVIECLVYFIYLMPVQDKVLLLFFLGTLANTARENLEIHPS